MESTNKANSIGLVEKFFVKKKDESPKDCQHKTSSEEEIKKSLGL